MFTGLVQAVGVVERVEATATGKRLVIDRGAWAHVPGHGESIAVNGCCLTAVNEAHAPAWASSVQTGTKEARACATGLVAFDIIPETLAKTTLGSLRPGDRVNLEHSVTASTLMGGHFVQGHVDGVGVVTAVETDGQHRVTIKPSAELMACMIPQGSVAVDGVSLTLAALDTDTISVALIPTTLALTSLGALRAGARVNIEADMLVKAVVKTVRAIESQRR